MDFNSLHPSRTISAFPTVGDWIENTPEREQCKEELNSGRGPRFDSIRFDLVRISDIDESLDHWGSMSDHRTQHKKASVM
jgi:hypothetical protein